MRFSLRAFLLAAAYVALVIGALMSRSATLSALVWLVTAAACAGNESGRDVRAAILLVGKPGTQEHGA